MRPSFLEKHRTVRAQTLQFEDEKNCDSARYVHAIGATLGSAGKLGGLPGR